MPDAQASITFCDQTFHLVEFTGAMPWMRFAKASRAGVDTDSMEGLALIYDLLKASIVDEEWPLFEQIAIDNRCDNDTMWKALTDVLEARTERPTERPSVSSDGPSTPSQPPRSEDDYTSQVVRNLEAKGRPELALVVRQTQEFLAG